MKETPCFKCIVYPFCRNKFISLLEVLTIDTIFYEKDGIYTIMYDVSEMLDLPSCPIFSKYINYVYFSMNDGNLQYKIIFGKIIASAYPKIFKSLKPMIKEIEMPED